MTAALVDSVSTEAIEAANTSEAAEAIDATESSSDGEQHIAHAIPAGTVLFGRYAVESKLAEGTIATVYRARDRATGVTIALKVFDPLRGADPVAQKRFERELEVLARIEHPGVARGFDLLHGHGLDALVLEYVEGESLSARLLRGPLDPDEAINLALAVADALQTTHEAGVIHRDLKPSNIVLHPERGPVILDFGVAWLSSAMTLTRTGAIVGSPRYLAPEAFGAAGTDQRADLYSLGAILYECVTGSPFRTAESVAELASDGGSPEAPNLSALVRTFPRALDGVVKRALAPRPEDRYATARELSAAIRSKRAALGRPLESRLRCSSCKTALIIDLSICPGCGQTTDWALEPGPFAVQLLEVPDPDVVARWIDQRHSGAARARGYALTERLRRAPVTLVLNASETTAEAIAAQARELGCQAIVVRARRVVGPSLRIPAATENEIVVASFLHFAVVAVVGLIFVLSAVLPWLDRLLPVAVAAAGVYGVLAYVRRPLLSIAKKRAQRPTHPMLPAIARTLAELKSDRSRTLAAAAVSRAAPVLLDDVRGLEPTAQLEVLDGLELAIQSASDADLHRAALEARPRAQLRADRLEAEAHRDEDRLAVLAVEESAITETSVAYDLSVRRALEACEAISAALATRSV